MDCIYTTTTNKLYFVNVTRNSSRSIYIERDERCFDIIILYLLISILSMNKTDRPQWFGKVSNIESSRNTHYGRSLNCLIDCRVFFFFCLISFDRVY